MCQRWMLGPPSLPRGEAYETRCLAYWEQLTFVDRYEFNMKLKTITLSLNHFPKCFWLNSSATRLVILIISTHPGESE